MAVGVQKTVEPQAVRDGGYVIGRREPNINAEQITLAATTVALKAGTVLGKVTASGKYVPHDPALANGAQTAAAILYSARPISTGDQRVAADVRGPLHVNVNLLTFKAGISTNDKNAAIAALSAAGIQAR